MSDIHEVYEQLLKNGFTDKDLQEQIKRKEQEFRGFITKEGALFLIAKEQGLSVYSPDIKKEIYEEAHQEIDYNEFLVTIEELRENMTNLVLLGKIVDIFPLKEFIRKDGTPGILRSFLLADGTGVIKILVWNDQSEIMDSEFFTVEKIIRIINAYCKKGFNNNLEVHLSKKSKILMDPGDIPKKIQQKLHNINIDALSLGHYVSEKNIHNYIAISDLYEMDGFLTSIKGCISHYELKEFSKDQEQPSFLLKFILTDETGEVQVNAWNMKAIEILSLIEKGLNIRLNNIFIKENQYTHQKELKFTKNSSLQIL
ncbi:MAG: hypothetical protein BAJALOKI1v1_430002 [Promethearchaeota archaeon]|nr:MAG: hypothetical protein BAJALOKI1v1_430002 [Candidatus Lokiarchaeota archaeon]